MIKLFKPTQEEKEKLFLTQEGQRSCIGYFRKAREKEITNKLINMMQNNYKENDLIKTPLGNVKHFVFKEPVVKNKLNQLSNSNLKDKLENRHKGISIYIDRLNHKYQMLVISGLIKYKSLTWFKKHLINNYFNIIEN